MKILLGVLYVVSATLGLLGTYYSHHDHRTEEHGDFLSINVPEGWEAWRGLVLVGLGVVVGAVGGLISLFEE